MCANGVDLGHACRLCGKPLLSCWDDGPSISWHTDEADARACMEVMTAANRHALPAPREGMGTLSTREHALCPECGGCLTCGIHTTGVICNGTSSTHATQAESSGLVAFLAARLDEDAAAAKAACEPDVSRNGEWIAYGHPPGMRDGRKDRDVQLVGAGPDEASWTVCEVGQWDRAPMVGGHIARHDPARALREVEAKRAMLTELTRWPFDYRPDCNDPIRLFVRLLAAPFSDHPDYRQEWKP